MNIRQPLSFSVVGGAATLVHMSVGVTLINSGVPPLVANMLAFLTALGVSFWGHYSYSFHGHSRTVFGAFRRFFVVALLGFAMNECLLSTFLVIGLFPPTTSLLTSTMIVALSTFFLSKKWAFRA